MRIVSYNVSGGLDSGAVAEVLARLTPDVVCILEAPGSGRLRSMARAADLVVAQRSGRRGSGTAILVRPDVRVLAASRVPLTVPRDVPAREATHAILGVGATRLSVTAVQLGLRPDVRRTNLQELADFLASVDLPTVVGADLNESRRSPVAHELSTLYQDAFSVAGHGDGATYPMTDPSTRQDFVFVDRSLEVRDAFVPDRSPVDVASHHRPVVADITASEPQDSDEAATSEPDPNGRPS